MLGLQCEEDGTMPAFMELRGTHPGGSPRLQPTEGQGWDRLFNTVYPQLETVVRNLIVMIQSGRDQFVDILLIGWW